MTKLQLYVPAILLGIGSLIAMSAERQEFARLDRPLNTLPIALAGVTGIERPLTEDERQVVGVSDYIFRIFQMDSLRAFSVYIGYYESQVTGKTIHSPRNCLPGAGWQIVESGNVQLARDGNAATVNRYIIANGNQQALVLYWYQGRGRVAHSEYAVKWDLLRDAATKGRTEEALVRVLVPIPPGRGDLSDWQGRLEIAEDLATQVANELLPSVERALPTWPTT